MLFADDWCPILPKILELRAVFSSHFGHNFIEFRPTHCVRSLLSGWLPIDPSLRYSKPPEMFTITFDFEFDISLVDGYISWYLQVNFMYRQFRLLRMRPYVTAPALPKHESHIHSSQQR
jgi:hypothetical protein